MTYDLLRGEAKNGPNKAALFFPQLRIPPETEFKGVDICEHGEAAYPVDAWVELQYSHTADNERPNVPRNMQGTHKYVMAIETRSGMHLCMHAGRSKWPKNDGVTIS
jgi:hypothetical protein